MTENELNKLRQKMAKLLNMTVENGCTEDEQESAMRMAAGLAARAGIESELEAIKNAAAAGTGPVKRAIKTKRVSQEFKVHQILAAQAAAELYGVRLYTYSGGKYGIEFLGREENCESAETTMFWLMRQVELLYKQNLPRGLSQSVRAEFRKTFKAACAHRVYERAKDLMWDMKMNEQSAQAATGQNALVVQGYFKQLETEITEYFHGTPEEQAARKKKEEDRRNALTPAERQAEDRELERYMKKAAKRKGPRPRTLPTGNGTAAGRMAGDSVKLRTEIG